MRKHLVKIVAVVLFSAFLFSVSAVPASALTFDKVESESYLTYRAGANSISDSYASSQYYENFRNVPLTGDARTDALAAALSQVGYQESVSGDYDGIGDGTSNYTEFNYNMGSISTYSYAWCATFVSWALYQGRATDQGSQSDWCRNNFYDSEYIWREVGCGNWATQLNYCGYFEYSYAQGGSYIPQPGDLIFYSWSSVAFDEDHIGMVVYCDGETVWTIEGNTSSEEGLDDEGGGVYFKAYDFTYSCITGYGVLPYASADVPEIDYSGANPTTGIYMATSGDKYVYEGIEDSANTWTLPKFSMFEVLDVKEDSSGNTMLYSKCEIDGSTVYGWILNGSATNGYTRVVQIYANPETPGIESDVYDITEENLVKGVSVNTTLADFLSSITAEGTVSAYKNGEALSETDKLGTGYTVQLVTDDGDTLDYTLVVKGDINGDAKINGFDYIMLKRHVMGTVKLEGVKLEAGSILFEDRVTAYDYIMLKRYVLGDIQF